MTTTTWPRPDDGPAVMIVGCGMTQAEHIREALALAELHNDMAIEILVGVPGLPEPVRTDYVLEAAPRVELPVYHVDSPARRPARRRGQKARQHWPTRRTP